MYKFLSRFNLEIRGQILVLLVFAEACIAITQQNNYPKAPLSIEPILVLINFELFERSHY